MNTQSGAQPTALVTGANRGIGRKTALRLAAQGVFVIVAGRDAPACAQVVAQIHAQGGTACTHPLDLAKPESIKEFLHKLEFPIGILVNNAGIFPDPDTSVFDVAPSSVRDAMEVHLHGPLMLSQSLVADMQTRGFGRVVNLSSGYASLPGMGANLTAYRCSKAALNALTCVLAAEVQGDIKVNAVDPGWVRTDMGGEKAPRSAAEAAADVVWAATLNRSGPHGKLLRYREVVAW